MPSVSSLPVPFYAYSTPRKHLKIAAYAKNQSNWSARRHSWQQLTMQAAAAEAASSTTQGTTVRVIFQQAGTAIDVPPGTNLYDAALQAGVDTITVGCCQGNCGVCEVEVVKRGPGSDGVPAVVRSCVVSVPPGYESLEVNELVDDIW